VPTYENERQAEIHAMTERDLQSELAASRDESEELRRKLDDLQIKVADATKAFEAMGSAERRLSEIAEAFVQPEAEQADAAA
jgi:hypothetical protein